jgi:hypothetical protein
MVLYIKPSRVNASKQNGVVERKNGHFPLGRSSQPAADLINRMPFRVLGHKTPNELLHGSNSFIVYVLIKQMFWLLVDNFSKSSLVMEGQRGGDIFLIDLNLN